MDKHVSDSRGFTLVELLVAMFTFTIVIAAIYSVFDVHNRMAARQEETTAMQQELLAAMSLMTYDLRMCGYSNNTNASDSAREVFNCTTPTEVRCRVGDKVIGYLIDNDKLKYDNGDGDYQPAAENMGTLHFAYLDENGTEIADPASNLGKIRSVEINATAIPSPHRAGLQINNRTMSTRVFVRNTSYR